VGFMGLVDKLCIKKGTESYFSETHRLETLYSEVVDEYRVFFIKWKRVNWERYRQYSDTVYDRIIKPFEWSWLNKKLIGEGLVPRKSVGQLRQLISSYKSEEDMPLFSIIPPRNLNQASNHSYS
jgi:hypothetical protein